MNPRPGDSNLPMRTAQALPCTPTHQACQLLLVLADVAEAAKVRDSKSLQLTPTYQHALPPATHQVCQVLIVPADVAEAVQGRGLEVRRCASGAHEARQGVQHLLRNYRRRQLAAAGRNVAQALGKQAGAEAPGEGRESVLLSDEEGGQAVGKNQHIQKDQRVLQALLKRAKHRLGSQTVASSLLQAL